MRLPLLALPATARSSIGVTAGIIQMLATASALAVEPSLTSPRALAAAQAANGPAAAAAAPTPAIPNRIRVKYREGPQAAAAGAGAPDVATVVTQMSGATVQSRARNSATNTEDLVLSGAVSQEELSRIASAIAGNPNVQYAVPESIQHAQQVNDPLFSQQWDLQQFKVGIRVPEAWSHSAGQNVIVAIVDTGIRKHADLVDRILDGYSFITDPARSGDGKGRHADATDPGDWCANAMSTWHGTHVAGTVAAATNNALGVAGIAYRAKILPVRVLGHCGGTNFDITDGIRWAAGIMVQGIPQNSNPARVINLSLGGTGECDLDYQDAIRQARQRGVTVVVAAGNSDSDAAGFTPASCEGVISVAATNRDGARADFGRQGAGSNYGASVKVAAPGGETFLTPANGILSTLNDGIRGPGNDSYEAYQGTSMSAPHVSGVVALMYQVYPSITPDEVVSILRSTSQPFPKVVSRQCDTSKCGSGIIDAEAAVIEAAHRSKQPPANTDIAPLVSEMKPSSDQNTGVVAPANIVK